MSKKVIFLCLFLVVLSSILLIYSCFEKEVRYDGLYLSKGEESSYYLRFYQNGTVLIVSSTGTPEQVAKWLYKDNIRKRGFYSIQGLKIKFSDEGYQGAVEYEGLIEKDVLKLNIYSHINGWKEKKEFKFIPIDLVVDNTDYDYIPEKDQNVLQGDKATVFEDNDFIIHGISLGMTEAEVMNILEEPLQIVTRTEYDYRAALDFSVKDLLFKGMTVRLEKYFGDYEVSQIIVKSRKYPTFRGLKFGDPKEKVEELYGKSYGQKNHEIRYEIMNGYWRHITIHLDANNCVDSIVIGYVYD